MDKNKEQIAKDISKLRKKYGKTPLKKIRPYKDYLKEYNKKNNKFYKLIKK